MRWRRRWHRRSGPRRRLIATWQEWMTKELARAFAGSEKIPYNENGVARIREIIEKALAPKITVTGTITR